MLSDFFELYKEVYFRSYVAYLPATPPTNDVTVQRTGGTLTRYLKMQGSAALEHSG